jgi:hypothetical protein
MAGHQTEMGSLNLLLRGVVERIIFTYKISAALTDATSAVKAPSSVVVLVYSWQTQGKTNGQLLTLTDKRLIRYPRDCNLVNPTQQTP